MNQNRKNESLLQQLIRQGRAIDSICGGNGKCGKCKICVTEGVLPVTKEDKNFFSKEELDQGYRLACKAFPRKRVKVLYLDKSTNSFEIVYNHRIRKKPKSYPDASGFTISVDIGTTTIVMALGKPPSLEESAIHTALNPCLRFGSDVISRMHASNTGKREEMQTLLKNAVREGVDALLKQVGVMRDEISGIVIAGNATMVHNLMGYSCKDLSRYPFTDDDLDLIETDSGRLWNDSYQTKIVILPCLSAFIGGDVISGLLYCRFHENENLAFFLDLGTNGEIALGNKDYILCTSVAAGPAFEGGNISCGTGSVEGAVYDVSILPRENETPSIECKTIGGKSPVGLCGTGTISLLYELRKNNWMSQTGLLIPDYFDTGFPFAKSESGKELRFSQNDVREMQLAISSIRAGLETLLKRYGATWEQVHSFYLAGGFGYHINIKKAVEIGLLPKILKSRIQTVGNTSLGGASEYLASTGHGRAIQRLLNRTEEITLADDEHFKKKFITYMNFPR